MSGFSVDEDLPSPDYLSGLEELQAFYEDALAENEEEEEYEEEINEERERERERLRQAVSSACVSPVYQNTSRERLCVTVEKALRELSLGALKEEELEAIVDVLCAALPAVARLFVCNASDPENWWTGTGVIVRCPAESESGDAEKAKEGRKLLIASRETLQDFTHCTLELGYHGAEGESVEQIPFRASDVLILSSVKRESEGEKGEEEGEEESLVVVDLSSLTACPLLPSFPLSHASLQAARSLSSSLSEDTAHDTTHVLSVCVGHPLGYAKRVSFGLLSVEEATLRAECISGCIPHSAPTFFGSEGSLVLSFLVFDNERIDGKFLTGVHASQANDSHVLMFLQEYWKGNYCNLF